MRLIQICGSAPVDIPDIDGAERWILGADFEQSGRTAWTRVFDVHDPLYITATRPHAWAWYAAQTKPVYLREAVPSVPRATIYPLRDVSDRFGARAGCAISSSMDQMMAIALLEGCDAIRLDGIVMQGIEEWLEQRECLAYWIGKAEAMGVEVTTHPLSALCVPETIYGFNIKTGASRTPGRPLNLPPMDGMI